MLVGTNEFPWCAYQKGWVWLTAWCLPWDNFQFWVLTLVRRHLEGTKIGLLAEYETGNYRKHQTSRISVYEGTCSSSKLPETWTCDVNLTSPGDWIWVPVVLPNRSMPCSSQLQHVRQLRDECFTERMSISVGEDLKLDLTWSWGQHVLTHHSGTHSRDPVLDFKSRSLPGQVQIFLSSMLRVRVHMKNASHNVTGCHRSWITRRWKRHVNFSWLVL